MYVVVPQRLTQLVANKDEHSWAQLERTLPKALLLQFNTYAFAVQKLCYWLPIPMRLKTSELSFIRSPLSPPEGGKNGYAQYTGILCFPTLHRNVQERNYQKLLEIYSRNIIVISEKNYTNYSNFFPKNTNFFLSSLCTCCAQLRSSLFATASVCLYVQVIYALCVAWYNFFIFPCNARARDDAK